MEIREQVKRGIKRMIRFQFFAVALIIAGGIDYGINAGKWSSAFGAAITLLIPLALRTFDIHGSYEPPGKIS